jgi:hypothetical protein
MYSKTLLYTHGGGTFDPTTFGLQFFPWRAEEFEELKDLIPCSMVAGRSKDTILDWKHVADRMAEELHNPIQPPWNRKYTATTVERAYNLRIVPDFYAKEAEQHAHYTWLEYGLKDCDLILAEAEAEDVTDSSSS